MFKNLTEYEILLLPRDFNLTDGHAFRGWLPSERAIIERAGEMLLHSDRRRQPEVEWRYVDTFMRFGRQGLDRSKQTPLMCTSASMAIEILANHVRRTRGSVALIEPCFDNIADIFKRHEVPLVSLPDACLRMPTLVDIVRDSSASVVFIVTPNNPTGSTLTEAKLRALVEYAERHDITIVLDCCFRAFLPDMEVYDQYGMLARSSANHVIIEDTGKTWPTAELKAPFLTASPRVYDELYDIYTDFILHVSPFILELLTAFVELSIQDRLRSVRDIIAANRLALKTAIAGHGVVATEEPNMSVSWLHLTKLTARQLAAELEKWQVYVLPGNQFFWSGSKRGEQYVRVALMRDPLLFARAAQLIGQCLQNVQTS